MTKGLATYPRSCQLCPRLGLTMCQDFSIATRSYRHDRRRAPRRCVDQYRGNGIVFFTCLHGGHVSKQFPCGLFAFSLAGHPPRIPSLHTQCCPSFVSLPSTARAPLSRVWPQRAAGQLMNACVALAKDWRTDKYLRRLEVSEAEGLLS